MKLSRHQFLHLAAGAAALPTVSRIAWAQAYPRGQCAHYRSVPGRRLDRHSRAPDRSVAPNARKRFERPTSRAHGFRAI